MRIHQFDRENLSIQKKIKQTVENMKNLMNEFNFELFFKNKSNKRLNEVYEKINEMELFFMMNQRVEDDVFKIDDDICEDDKKKDSNRNEIVRKEIEKNLIKKNKKRKKVGVSNGRGKKKKVVDEKDGVDFDYSSEEIGSELQLENILGNVIVNDRVLNAIRKGYVELQKENVEELAKNFQIDEKEYYDWDFKEQDNDNVKAKKFLQMIQKNVPLYNYVKGYYLHKIYQENRNLNKQQINNLINSTLDLNNNMSTIYRDINFFRIISLHPSLVALIKEEYVNISKIKLRTNAIKDKYFNSDAFKKYGIKEFVEKLDEEFKKYCKLIISKDFFQPNNL